MGGLASFVLLGIGWVLFGAASLRAHVFPTGASAAILVGGLLSGLPIGPAYLTGGIVLGLAIAWLGVWLMRSTAPVRDVGETGSMRSGVAARRQQMMSLGLGTRADSTTVKALLP